MLFSMDALTIIFLSMTAALTVILIVLVAVWAAMSDSPRRKSDEEELNTIKNEIEHEVTQEAEEELMPYKPPRLDKPTRRRL
jgi:Na+-transporting methylmalonyl-CoA/oxaloacetate decarboxylase gamma subunit